MTGRERFLAAVRHEVPDRIPVTQMGIRNSAALAAHLGVSPVGLLEALDLDAVAIYPAYTGPRPRDPEGNELSPWGTVEERYGGPRYFPMNAEVTPAQVERHTWPSPDAFDYAALKPEAARLGRKQALRTASWQPLFCRVCDLMGMEEAMILLASRTAVFEAIIDCAADFAMEFTRRMIDACGDDLPMVGFGDDFATQRGMMISPEVWRAVLKPRYARMFDLARRSGRHVIFHSCGDISAVLGDLIDIGMDIWQTVQLHTLPFSPGELKARYGRNLAFCGGINTQRLPFAAPRQVAEEVNSVIRALGMGGGFIVSPDHSVPPETPPPNVLALFEAAKAFRQLGYTL